MSNPQNEAAAALLRHRNRTVMAKNAEDETIYGTADFMTTAELRGEKLSAQTKESAAILLGRVPDQSGFEYAHYAGEGHLLTIAPTGAGKTAGAVMPNHYYPGSLLVIDPKGNVPRMGMRLRAGKLRQRVIVLDPWGVTKLAATAINPFDLLDPDDEDTIDNARLLANSLVIGETGANSYWSDLARSIVTAFIVHIVTFHPREQRNVQQLLDMAFCGMDKFYATYMVEIKCNYDFDGWLQEIAGLLETLKASDKLFGNVFVTIQRSLDFMRAPRMKRALTPPPGQPKFRFADLKRQAVTVYLVIPPDRLDAYGRWLRLMLSQAIIEVSRDETVPAHPVLFMLDEFAALQRLEIIETAIGLMRGYHMKLWPIVQDLSQLKQHYPARWTSFIANAGVLQVFNVNDLDTAEYISKRLGTRSGWVMGKHTEPSSANTLQAVQRPLMTPDEVMRMPEDEQLLFFQGQRPYIANKLKHWDDRELKDDFDRDPMR